MTDLLQAVMSRRSIKKFDPSHTLSDAQLTEILDAGRHAPTAFNLQNVRFLVVRDREQLRKIRAVSWDQPQIEDCSALVVLCADLKAWEKDPARYWKNAPAEVRDLYANRLIPQYYQGNERVQRDEGFRSCGLAGYALMMAAAAHGLGSCAMDGFDFDKVKEIINLPADHELIMFVAIGKAAEQPQAHPGYLPLEEVVLYDRFS